MKEPLLNYFRHFKYMDILTQLLPLWSLQSSGSPEGLEVAPRRVTQLVTTEAGVLSHATSRPVTLPPKAMPPVLYLHLPS